MGLSSLPARGVLTVIGCFLVQFMLGAFYTFGNIMPYLVSYMRESANITVTYSDFATVQLVYGVANGLSLFLAPLVLVPAFGMRNTAVIGAVLMCVGVVATRWTMDHSLILVILTYGFVQGFGNLALIPTYIVPMRWFPDNRGAVMGVVVGGIGISGLVLNPVALALANPNNVEAVNTTQGSDDKYFTDPDVIDRVPMLLYALTGLYAVGFAVGLIMFSEPVDEKKKEKEEKPKKSLSYRLSSFRRHVLVRPEFYLLFATRFCITLVTMGMSTYYKAFGLTFIDSDKFITTYVSTLSGIWQFICRMSYGMALDVLPYRLVMCNMSLILTVFVSTLYFTSDLGQVAFAVWMAVIYLNFPGIYAILPAKATEVFGAKHSPGAIGCVALGDIVLNLSVGVVGDAILDGSLESYLHFFLFVAAGPAVCFVVTLLFPPTKQDEERSDRLKHRLKTIAKCS